MKGARMWKCLNCGAEFEKPLPLPHCEDGVMGIWNYCPECRVDDIEELSLCFCERKYISDEQDRCPECEREISEIMSEARQRIKDSRNVDHQQATEDIVWWVEREG